MGKDERKLHNGREESLKPHKLQTMTGKVPYIKPDLKKPVNTLQKILKKPWNLRKKAGNRAVLQAKLS